MSNHGRTLLLAASVILTACATSPEPVVVEHEEPPLLSAERAKIDAEFQAFLTILPLTNRGVDHVDFADNVAATQAAAFQLFRSVEEYFLGSGGNREVFGWATFRQWQISLNLACDPLTTEVPPDPTVGLTEYERAMLTRAEQHLDMGRVALEFGIAEGAPPWSDLARSHLDLISDVETASRQLCDELDEYW